MSIEQQEQWITGEEFARENRRLIEAGIPDEAPEFQALFDRAQARDDSLYERYGKQYLATHYGKWIAISPDGDIIIENTAGDVLHAARERFGPGNAAIRKLAEFPGYDFLR
jgi:hypothetical protein